MTRRELRKHVFTLLFCCEFYEKNEINQQKELYLDNPEVHLSEEQAEHISARVDLVLDKKEEIDELVNNVSENWKTDRMGKVELSLIRLGCYEMKYDDDIPTAVAINEAVELAKIYGSQEAGAFVNGVLAKLL